MLGSLLGSFANVVIYRLPLRQEPALARLALPACNHAIRWHDNVPVLGWLLLGGKCRDCRTPISARYPLVEALFGALLGGLAWLELAQGPAKLPLVSSADGACAAAGVAHWLSDVATRHAGRRGHH